VSQNDQKVPSLTVKRVFKEAGSRCPFCGEEDLASLDVHHISPRKNGGSNDFANLLLACKNCHARIESGEVSVEKVFATKLALATTGTARGGGRAERTGNAISITGDVASSIVANTVTFRGTPKKAPRMEYPAGCIGANLEQRNYVDYLVRRYNEFRAADRSFGARGSFFHGKIHQDIQKRFRVRTYFIREGDFDELVQYLQGRIDQTILGKRNRAGGRPSYRAFGELADAAE
jgi:hypothetical protein